MIKECRVKWVSAPAHFVMQVWACASACATNIANELTAFNTLPGLGYNAAEVAIQRCVAEAVVDNNMVSIAPAVVHAFHYNAIAGCINLGAYVGSEIHASMKAGGSVEWV